MMENKTFQELVDEIGLSTVFSGTDADEAIMNVMLEWFFDYRLCNNNNNTFLRYFRRRFNNLYPRYLEQLSILTQEKTFDPFVTEYFTDLINHEGNESSVSEKTTSGDGETNVTDTKGSGSQTVRTPNLTTHNIGENSISNETTSQDSGNDSVARTGTDTTATTEASSTTSNTKSDGIGIAYPESNLAAIPVDIDATRTIDYASSESISLGKTTTSGTGNTNSTVTHNTTDTTTHGLRNEGSSDTTGNEESTQTQTGNETTVVTNSGSDTHRTVNESSGTENENTARTHADEENHTHTGRNETVIDILPRAIRAIANTNELMWFIDSMKVCFDCTSLMY